MQTSCPPTSTAAWFSSTSARALTSCSTISTLSSRSRAAKERQKNRGARKSPVSDFFGPSVYDNNPFASCRSELNAELLAHASSQALQRPQGWICIAMFQLADIRLRNPRPMRQLFLRQSRVLPRINHRLNDVELRRQSIILSLQFRVFHLLFEKIIEIRHGASVLSK